MPVPVDDSLVDALEASLRGIVDALRGGVQRFGQALSVEQLLARLAPIVEDLVGLLVELRAVVPAANDRFLAADGQTPGLDQLSIDDFAVRLVDELVTRIPRTIELFGDPRGAERLVDGAPPSAIAAPPPAPPPAPADLAEAIAAFLRAINPALDPEVFIRFINNIVGHLNGQEAARRTAEEMARAMEATVEAWAAAGWPEDAPADDADKDEYEPDVGIPEVLGRVLDHFTADFPGASPPADPVVARRVGRDVHRAVMGAYVAAHPNRLVVVDGRLRISGLADTPAPPGTPGPPVPLGIRVSDAFSPEGEEGLDASQLEKVLAFSNLMRDATTNRRVQPDIADLGTPATTRNDDWGWFEIKPMGNVRRAVEELWYYYLPTWNRPLAGGPHDPDWIATEGAWQPVTIFITPRYFYLFGAITVLPGAIGYLTYELENTARAAVLTGLTVLAGLFLRRLLTSLRRAAEDIWAGGTVVGEFLFAWCIAILGMFLLLWASEGLIVTAGLEGLAIAVASALARLAELVRQLLPS
jgi:hypothetical protein